MQNGFPLKNPNIKQYTGFGSGVLKPGTIVAEGGYKGPQSIVANKPGMAGTYVQYSPGTSSPAQVGTGDSGSANRQANIDLINQSYNTQLNNYRAQLGSLSDAQKAAERQIGSQFNNQLNKLETGVAQGRRNLADATNAVTEKKVRSLKDLQDQFRQSAMSYNNQLGAMGAGDSSAARLIGQALGGQVSRNRGDVLGNAADQYNTIDRQSKDLEISFEQNKRDLDTWRGGMMNDVATRFAQQRAEIQNAMASATAEQQQRLLELDAGNVQDAIRALQNLESQYAQGISSLTDRYRAVAQPTQYSIDPSLQEYAVRDINAGQIAGLTMPDQVNPEADIVSALLRRRQEEQLV